MTSLKDYIKEKRSSLSESSLNTYNSILRSLHKKVFGEGEIDFKNFDNTEKILDHLKDLTSNKRKTILSALVIITDNKKYRDQMLEDVRDYNKEISKQVKTDTQEENWVTQEELKNLYDTLKKSTNIIYKKEHKNINDLQIIQNFIILAIFTLIPPRRSMDFVNFKIKNINKETDNFMEKGKFIFNSYKTAKTYGQQIVNIPKELSNIINKWINVNPTEFLLFDNNFNQLSSVKLNQRFNKLFNGKKIAINALRHSYLTEKYADDNIEMNNIKKNINNDMTKMGSSSDMAETYIKIN